LQALAVLRVDRAEEEAFRAVFTEAVEKLQIISTVEHVRWYYLVQMLLAWISLRRPAREREPLREIAKEHQPNPERRKDVELMIRQLEPSAVDLALAEGREQGKAEGELRARREDLQILLEDRFGPLPPEWIVRIETADDIQRLREAIRQVLKVENLDDIKI
jgi:hypothetical protein